MVERNCGSCTLCCKVLAIRELDKPGDTWCSHCDKGSGCQIYENRPESCRSFQCLWLTSPETLADGFRPDKVKIVMSYKQEQGTVTLYSDTGFPGAHQRPRIVKLTNAFKRNGLKVIVQVGDRIL